ncbi:hypothetical protein QNI19_37240 [Cytophagaceae bacterium DM2B3-1]|uniref:Uncharacterized protein n=1 Tax=Xanthocytophaga flava TaxID=3048013 RepID=A0ABT7D1H9_9BACT|nr:hypothetical protein [Xanthocytophaga flavus]MDJ1498639.1 hypothetical protein [Xanthocytophaga flavus]
MKTIVTFRLLFTLLQEWIRFFHSLFFVRFHVRSALFVLLTTSELVISCRSEEIAPAARVIQSTPPGASDINSLVILTPPIFSITTLSKAGPYSFYSVLISLTSIFHETGAKGSGIGYKLTPHYAEPLKPDWVQVDYFPTTGANAEDQGEIFLKYNSEGQISNATFFGKLKNPSVTVEVNRIDYTFSYDSQNRLKFFYRKMRRNPTDELFYVTIIYSGDNISDVTCFFAKDGQPAYARQTMHVTAVNTALNNPYTYTNSLTRLLSLILDSNPLSGELHGWAADVNYPASDEFEHFNQYAIYGSNVISAATIRKELYTPDFYQPVSGNFQVSYTINAEGRVGQQNIQCLNNTTNTGPFWQVNYLYSPK